MFSGFPKDSYKKFQSALRKADGETGFEKLNSYYDSVVHEKGSRGYWDVNKRFDSGNFFYYPFEGGFDIGRRTCFENSVHFLMASQELYPASNPRFAYVDEGKRGVHSITMFNHKGKFYGGDFSYEFFGPIDFNGKNIVRPGGEKIKFKSITPLSDLGIRDVIKNLRGGDGCRRYLCEGGQRMLDNPDAFRPYEIFMKFDGGNLISELRFRDFGLIVNTAIRRSYGIENDEFNMEYLCFSHGDWSDLLNEQRICWNKKADSIDSGVIMNGHSSLKELEASGLDDFVKQFSIYNSICHNMAAGRHRKLEDVFLYSSKSRRNYLEDTGDRFKSYVQNLKESSFKEHILDFCLFKNNERILRQLRPEGPAKTWKDIKAEKGAWRYYSRSFFDSFLKVSKKETRIHRGFNKKVLDLLR